MKFSEFLNEMAFRQGTSLERIELQTIFLIEHIFKIWLMPNSENYNHWSKEIQNFVNLIDNFCNVKTRSGRIPYKTLKKSMQNLQNQKWLEKQLNYVIRDYQVIPLRVDLVTSIQNFLEYFWNLLSLNRVDKFELLDYIQNYKHRRLG